MGTPDSRRDQYYNSPHTSPSSKGSDRYYYGDGTPASDEQYYGDGTRNRNNYQLAAQGHDSPTSAFDSQQSRFGDSKKNREPGLSEKNKNLNKVAVQTLKQMRLNDPRLKALDISNMTFAPKFYRELVSDMKHNTNLTELYLNNCGITCSQVQQIVMVGYLGGSSVGGLPQLRVLSLENNCIRNTGCMYISKALAATIKGPVSKFQRTHGGAKTMLAGPLVGLKVVSLRSNYILGAEGCRFLANALIQKNIGLSLIVT